MAKFRTLTKGFVIGSNIVVALLFLLACANSFLHPDKWWFISLLGLIFPLLLLFVIGFFLFWLFLSARRWSLISLVAMLIGWTNIHAFFAFHFSNGFNNKKEVGDIRVLTWNIRSWDEFLTAKTGSSGHKPKMMDFIKQEEPDIICFQEFYESHDPKDSIDNIQYLQEKLGYPYYFFSKDYQHLYGNNESGVAIFSRFPILNTFQKKFQKTNNRRTTESIISVDVDVKGKTTRVLTTHLQSVLFQSKDFHNVEIIKNAEDSMVEASKSLVKKLKRGYTSRGYQADLLKEIADSSSYPIIICGDFNDVPNSYTYFRILGTRQDAFIKKGFGIGRTYVNLSPTLRIDYIIASKNFTVQQCKRFNLPYSDHHPVIADFKMPD